MALDAMLRFAPRFAIENRPNVWLNMLQPATLEWVVHDSRGDGIYDPEVVVLFKSAFSEKTKGGTSILRGKISFKIVVIRHVSQLWRIVNVGSQRFRRKTMKRLGACP